MHSFTSKLQEALHLRDDVWGPLQTPGRTDKKIVRGQDPEINDKYRSHVGALNWLTMCLRYDLTYTTKELSRVLPEPTKTANEILKRALNYTIQTNMPTSSFAMKTCRTTSLQRPDANQLTKKQNVMTPSTISPTE